MIRGLILYYLNIKPTHGYEIQRFIQLSGMEQWAKIQSGSIYYALSKLEKEKNIQVQREETTGARIRKIYEITPLGREKLQEEMRMELATPIMPIGSLKFIIEPIIGSLGQEVMEDVLKTHIEELKEKKDYWNVWKKAKAGEEADGLTKLAFDMTIHSLEEQIAWHQELLNNLGFYIGKSQVLKEFIQVFEPDSLKEGQEDLEVAEKIRFIEEIKDVVEKNPELAIENLNRIIEEIKNNH